MKIVGLEKFIVDLEEAGEVVRVYERVDVNLEMAEIVDRVSKSENGGKALLFENTSTNFPVLINMYGSYKRACMAFGIDDLQELEDRIQELFTQLMSNNVGFINKLKILPKLAQLSSFIPKKISGKGVCQQNISYEPDLNKLPVIKCWPHDGGNFITLPLVHTISHSNGIHNVGMYRMQIFNKNTTGMHWHMHKGGAQHFKEYKQIGAKMPVSVVLGGDPVYTYVATAPLPENIDEYILAGFIRKKAVTLVKCITNDIYVPNDADIVIEGFVDPSEDFVVEGPFGDHTGFYSLEDMYPKFHVTCITYKNNAVYPATLVGIPPMEDAIIGSITEKIFRSPIKFTLIPELVDLHLPIAGVAHNLVIVSAKKQFPGNAFKIAHAVWGAGQLMFSKVIIVVNDNIDVFNYKMLWNLFLKSFSGDVNILFSKGPTDVLDHASSKFAYGGKLCIDLTSEPNLAVNEDKYVHILDVFNRFTKVEMPFLGLYFIYNNKHSVVSDLKNVLSEHNLPGCIIVVDQNCYGLNLSTLLWYVLGNIDPLRDIEVINSFIIVDGKRKSDLNSFSRRWPEVVKMDKTIIDKVDSKWSNYNIGSIIESPSKIINNLIVGNKAELSE